MTHPIPTATISRTRQSSTAPAGEGRTSDLLCCTDTEYRPWWIADLDGQIVVSGLTIEAEGQSDPACAALTVSASLDGAHWYRLNRENGSQDARCILPALARHLKIQLDEHGSLRLKRCDIHGRAATSAERRELGHRHTEAQDRHHALTRERVGTIETLQTFGVFADSDRYPPVINEMIRSGEHERRERALVGTLLKRGDKVLEAGTAIGAVTLTAAGIVGPENVITFDANPHILDDARRNFAFNEMNIATRNGILKNRKQFQAGEEVDFHLSSIFLISRLHVDQDDFDIVETVRVPTFCLEDEIARHGANVLICDIEGGEVPLLHDADLSDIHLIILEIHYWALGRRATDDMIRKILDSGFDLNLHLSGHDMAVFHRRETEQTTQASS